MTENPGRGRWRIAGVLVCALLLSACAGGGDPAPAAPAPAAGGTFPVSIDHEYGTTTIPAEPKRVVSLGYVDQDPILALGVVPVAIREFTGNKPSATWPWAADKLNGQQPQVLNGATIDPETVAALDPDLIVAVGAGLTREQYDTFSAIAPTIAQPKGAIAYGTPWPDATRMISTALGRDPQAEQLVSGLEAKFAQAKAANPALVGKKAMIAGATATGAGTWFAYSSQDPRGRFLSALGMVVPPDVDAQAGQSFYAEISLEKLAMLDEADVVGWIDVSGGNPAAALTAQPGYRLLGVVKGNRVVTLTADQAAAMSFSSVLSLPALLDSLPGRLTGAISG